MKSEAVSPCVYELERFYRLQRSTRPAAASSMRWCSQQGQEKGKIWVVWAASRSRSGTTESAVKRKHSWVFFHAQQKAISEELAANDEWARRRKQKCSWHMEVWGEFKLGDCHWEDWKSDESQRTVSEMMNGKMGGRVRTSRRSYCETRQLSEILRLILATVSNEARQGKKKKDIYIYIYTHNCILIVPKTSEWSKICSLMLPQA